MRPGPRLRMFGVWLCLASLAACARAGSPPAHHTLIVFAAASLTQAFTEIAADFETSNRDVDVAVNFAGSQALALQLGQGAPADVFASADEAQMAAAVESGRVLADDVQVFATNRLVVVFPLDNPGGLRQLTDLSRPGLRLVLAAQQVPAGRYALEFLDKASAEGALGDEFKEAVLDNVVSYEEDVRRVLGKVALGEADAGIVYASDAKSAEPGTVGRLEIPDAWNASIRYPIAAVADAPEPDLARAFVDLVLGPTGQSALTEHGLQPFQP